MITSLALAACASTVPPVEAPVAPSTHRDPPTYVPAPEAEPTTGALVGAIASGGEDQARALLVAIVLGIRDGDVEALRALLADEVLQAVRSRRISGARLAEQWVARARLARLPSELPFEALIEVESIRVTPIPREPETAGLLPSDLLVRFTVTQLARHALGALASADGRGALVVRPGEDPRVVAR